MKISKETIYLPFSQIINNSISKEVFPDIYKQRKASPYGSRLHFHNYRPISVLPNLTKIIKKLIHSRLNLFLEQHNSIFQFQLDL